MDCFGGWAAGAGDLGRQVLRLEPPRPVVLLLFIPETWAFEYFPYTRPELIRADLELGLVPSAWRWYRTNLHTVRQSVDHLALPSEDITEVPVGLVNQMMELVLGMQQELTAAWSF
ncbi:hypothetical protein JCGZ_09863 [Jatropha curcas]|uniref:Aminotransferase-like plant mobile domain-containing protein n=1 Tax=Jatropha curcas TaxID=180498 RepID=A0A067J926_JATCU|nr:hypothetical protein JCGZ_09863 [Jatropha curcas]